MRMIKVMIATAALAVAAYSPVLGHEDHDALGAGPGRPASPQTEATPGGIADHASMPGMHGPAGPADKALGRDVAADDMAMSHGAEAAAAKRKTFGERLVSWLGRLHTAAIHFPIAMIIGAFAVELYVVRRGGTPARGAAAVMLVVGALGAITAASLGWFAGGFYLTDRNPVLMTHRWLGTLLAVLSVFLASLALRRRGGSKPGRLYLGLLGLTAIAIAVQGYLGGSFMHGGLDHLAF